MRRYTALLASAAVMAAVAGVVAQQQPADPTRTPGVQAGRDPNRAAFIAANCKANPAQAAGPQAAPGAPGGAARAGGAPPAPPTFANAPTTAVPGVVAAGKTWRKVWEGSGNNTDSPIATDGGILLAQNDLSQIIEVRLDGKHRTLFTDTYTGGALALTPNGTLYVGERALNRGIWQVKPRTLFTNTMNGEPLECTGPGVLNDLVADNKGGMYMTMGGVYYANAKGVVSGRYGTVGGNGIAVSKDNRTLYVTGRLAGATLPANLKLPAGAPEPTGGVVAFDIQPDGSLTNERQFGWAGGDGMALDTEGRLYVPGNNGAWVIDPKSGEFLAYIPTPPGTHGLHFGGPNQKTLFSIQLNAMVTVWAMDMEARGFQLATYKP